MQSVLNQDLRDQRIRHRSDNRGVRAAQRTIAFLFGEPTIRTFGVRYWDGTYDVPGAGQDPRFTLVLRRAGALRRLLMPPSELAVGEAFVRNDIDIEGDLEAAAALPSMILRRALSLKGIASLVAAVAQLPSDSRLRPILRSAGKGRAVIGHPHSKQRDREAVAFHYDLGNEFYSLWLDQHMAYSCGYFETGTENIDSAQEAKLDLICRKLRLKAGERLLDIGCGWGGLVRYAARNYGAQAVGITLSIEQAAFARRQISAEGLTRLCSVELCDYREVPSHTRFDKVASVGMFEHVGANVLPNYFATAFRLLSPGGLFLNHGIVMLDAARPRHLMHRASDLLLRKNRFVSRYVFPDGELVRLSDAILHAERVGFETRDVESLREHYARTLRHWVARLEGNRSDAIPLVGEQTYRVWRLYMAVSARAFATGQINVTQMLFAKPDAYGRCCAPSTRHDIYGAGNNPRITQ